MLPAAGLPLFWQSEAHDVRSHGEGYELFSIHGIRHGRGFDCCVQRDAPQCFAVARADCDEIAAWVSIEDNPAGGGHHTRHPLTVYWSGLRDLPDDISGLDVECAEILLSRLLGGDVRFSNCRVRV